MPKILKPLTVAQIDKMAATPYASRRDLRDGMIPGLHLRLGAQVGSWSYYVTVGPKRVVFKLGEYPELGLAEARAAAIKMKDNLTAVRASSCGYREAELPDTLEALLTAYGTFRGERLRTWQEALRAIKRVWGRLYDKPLVKQPLNAFQHALDTYPSIACAAEALRYLRPILKWARKRGYVSFDPMQLDMPKLDYTPRDRVLSDEELAAVLRALGSSVYDTAVKLLLLTACRKSEVTEARWDEFDLDNGLWRIPRGRMKTNAPQTVPLPVEAISILRGLPRTTPYILGVPPSNWDRYQKALFKKSGTSGWHRHDLRRTAATILGKLDFEPHVIEVVLAHKNVYSRLAATYNHHRYEKQHREALEALSAYYRKLLT
jgi:integrase